MHESTNPGPDPTVTSGSQWARMQGDEIARRNRYLNVDPYANNRIHLKVPEGHNDYINASPIVLGSREENNGKYFIATQVRYEPAAHRLESTDIGRDLRNPRLLTFGVWSGTKPPIPL